MTRIFNSQLRLKVEGLSFKILDALSLIFISNNATFLHWFVSQSLGYNFQHLSIR